MRWLVRHWPLVFGFACFAAVLSYALIETFRFTAGCLAYPLDDTYIHLALAQNLSRQGVWGVTHYECCSASSSPLWTGLLALVCLVCGPCLEAPLVLAVLAACGVLTATYAMARREGWPNWLSAVVLLALIAWTPLLPLAFSGMEHALHLLLCILFLYFGAAVIIRGDRTIPHAAFALTPNGSQAKSEGVAALLLITPALALTRYESLLLVFVFCLAAGVRRRWKLALSVGLAALAPLVIFGLIWLAHGGFFLPNSVLRKASLPGMQSAEQRLVLYGLKGWMRLVENVHLMTLLLAVFFLLLPLLIGRRRGTARLLGCILLPAAWLHLNFAATGWYYRYEAYLMGLGIVTLGSLTALHVQGIASARGWRRLLAAAPLAGIVAAIAGNSGRAVEAVWRSPQAARNIHEQQCQMARFVARYYAAECVALNDIGAVCYFAGSPIVDLWGLASNDVLAAVRGGQFTPTRIAQLCSRRGMQAAILYPGWFREWGGLPKDWPQVGSWRIRDNVICAGDEVVFFAPTQALARRLAAHLRDFAPLLPATVQQRITYHD